MWYLRFTCHDDVKCILIESWTEDYPKCTAGVYSQNSWRFIIRAIGRPDQGCVLQLLQTCYAVDDHVVPREAEV